MSPLATLLPLMQFDEACALVVGHLKREVPLAFWSVSQHVDDRQVYLSVRDDAYGKVAGDSHAWSDSFCRSMVAGAAPQIAPDAMAVPAYAAAGVSRKLAIGAYVGVPIRGAGGNLFGTLCGLDPGVQSDALHRHTSLLHLLATLLGQILTVEQLRVDAVHRQAQPGLRDLRLHEPLRRAIASGDLHAVYQPIVELGDGRPVAFEALARWRHEGVAVDPDVLVGVAARTGLMSALTDHMLDSAGAQLARWSAQLGHRDLRVGINVSPHCISDPRLPGRVAACVARHRLAPGQLVIEITEDALLTDLPRAAAVTRRLQALGVALSLDDFGIGYSSLLHLQQIPLHSIKIDQGFARDLDTNPATERFMKALLALGRNLGLGVVVEGVERQGQADVLRRLGATHAQGHLFGRPAAPEDLRR